eukprot:gene10978-14746_t
MPPESTFYYTPPAGGACLNSIEELGWYGVNNSLLSAVQTIYNCIKNTPDSLLPPPATNNIPIMVNSSIQINNLHSIDAIAGTVTLDFYLRLFWTDSRLDMPLFWKKTTSTISKNGLELTYLINRNDVPLPVWMPDIRFHDAASLEFLSQTFRITKNYNLFWSRHILITLKQPKLFFANYPLDAQTIYIRFGSYAYNNKVFRMGFTNISVALTMNDNYDGSKQFKQNPEWNYVNYDVGRTYTSASGFLNSIYKIHVVRRGSGIIARLIKPIVILLFIGALSFWAETEKRAELVVTILLSVSALYIVILSNIPLVGYLTEVDQFIAEMFTILCVTVAVHHMYVSLHLKSERFPLRLVAMRFIELVGRVLLIPTITAIYELRITKLANMSSLNSTFLTAIYVVFAIIFLREFTGFIIVSNNIMKKLKKKFEEKIESEKGMEMTRLELFILWLLGGLHNKVEMFAHDHPIEDTIIKPSLLEHANSVNRSNLESNDIKLNNIFDNKHDHKYKSSRQEDKNDEYKNNYRYTFPKNSTDASEM